MNLPIEIIYYIYEFDSTYKENMNKVLTQLKNIFESYNEEYNYNKAMLRRLVYKGRFYDNNCYFNYYLRNIILLGKLFSLIKKYNLL